MTFYARATVGVGSLTWSCELVANRDCFLPKDKPVHFTIHPALMGHLEFDIASQPLDHDFGLPNEEILSSAVHPPVQILVLENEQGLSQNIEVLASDKEIGVTVKDVLKAIGADLRKSSSQPELAALDEDTLSEVEDTSMGGARTEETSSNGFQRIDYLRGKKRLRVLPKHPRSEKDDKISRPIPLQVNSTS